MPKRFLSRRYPTCDWQKVATAAGESWHIQNQTKGVRYSVSLCTINGGFTSGTWDSELTVHGNDGIGNLTFLGYNNNACDNIRAKVKFDASSSIFASVKRNAPTAVIEDNS
ncbi:MAG: hypothetical protein ACI83H_002816 [Glaciecola sp.]|jgi:hypothetical protein